MGITTICYRNRQGVRLLAFTGCGFLDWKDYGVNDIIKRCTQDKNLGNGSIILLHSGTKYTKDALEAVIVGLKEKGYQLVPVSELIYKENFDIDNAGRQFKR